MAHRLVGREDVDEVAEALDLPAGYGQDNKIWENERVAELDLRTAASRVAADLTRHVAELLSRAQAAGAARNDVSADDVMALVAWAFAAIQHAGAEASGARAARIAQVVLDGLRAQPRERPQPSW